ncbi:MAG TPA: protein-disulfide reductase DsbD N-terminal domain-containing protein [Terracidiphilus sp.]|nr:protein-disulfide reductase DsbD N-terminal domain-containing protein [Terracidiphilus sp.]
MNTGMRMAAAAAFGMAALLANGQADSASRSVLRGAAVEYMFPEQVTVAAGKATDVTLHFRIAPGLHINSHTPKDEFLIPTSFSIPDGLGVRLEAANYPAGTDFTLPSDPQNKLSVYTGEFTIQARIVAEPGNHLVEARLHFQACNDTSCMPPKTIPVAIDVIGR